VAVSIRIPRDLYQELGRYAQKVGAPKSYLVVECLRRLLAARGIRGQRKLPRSHGAHR
jgi:predicted DNA-binding protein